MHFSDQASAQPELTYADHDMKFQWPAHMYVSYIWYVWYVGAGQDGEELHACFFQCLVNDNAVSSQVPWALMEGESSLTQPHPLLHGS